MSIVMNIYNVKFIKNIVFIFILFNVNVFAQVDNAIDSMFCTKEHQLTDLLRDINDTKFNDVKIDTLNKKVLGIFGAVLQKKRAFEYSFDSILFVSKIVSEDKKIRFFTWAISYSDGTYKHFGFMQYYSEKQNKVLLFSLIDKSDSIKNIDNVTLSTDNWFGAMYYDIVQTKDYYGDLYVLLGWDGNNLFSKKKVIESLRVVNDKPIFGLPVFIAGKEIRKRVIFEYSRMSSMMLKYDKSYKMIVFDHLEPSSYIYNGNYQYYGPDLTIDALKYNGDKWVYKQNIDYKPQGSRRKKR